MNTKPIVQISTCLAILAVLLSTLGNMSPVEAASADPRTIGVGWFIHVHDGMVCTHSFGFSVWGGTQASDGWYYDPSGAFTLVCRNSTAVCMTIVSFQIWRFRVQQVSGGWMAVFEGLASSNMGSGWQKGWWFRVTAFDYGSPGKGLDVMQIQLWDPAHWSGELSDIALNPPEGQHNCQNTLSGGNITVKP